MLEPNDRELYFEALRPPPGFDLDLAVGTTYSLDLHTLLALPLALSLYGWDGEPEEFLRDPVALLDALRRQANRMIVFCQAGRIAPPAVHHPLFAYLERSVVEAAAPRGGAFHPKVWCLRFSAESAPPEFRLLVLTRNLGRDRSWDTLLRLDGSLVTTRQRAFAVNRPLGAFFAALPNMANRTMPRDSSRAVRRLARQLLRVRFETPPGFEGSVRFHPGGFGDFRGDPFPPEADRVLVISPFVAAPFLGRLAAAGPATLVSRADRLDEVPPQTLRKFRAISVLDDGATALDDDAGDQDHERVARGLHAKLFAFERGWRTYVFTGSANATRHAFSTNVEMLVELEARRSKLSVAALVDEAMGSLLCAYPIGRGANAPDAESRENEKRLEDARRALARVGLRLRARRASSDTFILTLYATRPLRMPGIAGEVRPMATSGGQSLATLLREGSLSFPPLAAASLSSFIVFDLSAGSGRKRATARFAMNLPLQGGPANRLGRVLEQVLSDRDRVARYMMLLLAREEGNAPRVGATTGRADAMGWAASPADVAATPLLEELLDALANCPERLDAVSRVVADLRRTPKGRQLLPEGFDRIWEPIWEARRGIP